MSEDPTKKPSKSTAKVKTEKPKSDKPKGDRVKSDKVKTDRVKIDRAKGDKIKTDRVKTDRVKTDRVKTDRVKTDKVPTDKVKTEKVKIERVKTVKVKTEKVVPVEKPKKVVKFKKRPEKTHGRLYARAVFTGFRRGLRNQHENTALLKVDGCDSKSDSWFYVGKRVAYVYRVCVACFY